MLVRWKTLRGVVPNLTKKPEQDLDFTEISGQQSLRKQIVLKHCIQSLKN